eukprot:2763423-Amphidinium_carterae.4
MPESAFAISLPRASNHWHRSIAFITVEDAELGQALIVYANCSAHAPAPKDCFCIRLQVNLQSRPTDPTEHSPTDLYLPIAVCTVLLMLLARGHRCSTQKKPNMQPFDRRPPLFRRPATRAFGGRALDEEQLEAQLQRLIRQRLPPLQHVAAGGARPQNAELREEAGTHQVIHDPEPATSPSCFYAGVLYLINGRTPSCAEVQGLRQSVYNRLREIHNDGKHIGGRCLDEWAHVHGLLSCDSLLHATIHEPLRGGSLLDAW